MPAESRPPPRSIAKHPRSEAEWDKAFGETRFSFGALGTDYKFTGQREEASLGLYFFQSRWFDPSLGRFLSPDTIVPTGSQGTQAWDRYAFVNNNPVRYNDPTGHDLGPFGITLGLLDLGAIALAVTELASVVAAVVLAPEVLAVVAVVAVVVVVASAAAYVIDNYVQERDIVADDQVPGVRVNGPDVGTIGNPNPCLFCGLSKYAPWIVGGTVVGTIVGAACDLPEGQSCTDVLSKHDEKRTVTPTSTSTSQPAGPLYSCPGSSTMVYDPNSCPPPSFLPEPATSP